VPVERLQRSLPQSSPARDEFGRWQPPTSDPDEIGKDSCSNPVSPSLGNDMSTNVANKIERGVKRTCQNPECASRFYDLNRDTIVCPICQSPYIVVSQPPPQSSRLPARSYKKPPIVREEVKAEESAEAVEIEAEEETADEVADDTLIEEVDDDNVDVTGIVDTPTHGDEKL